jgi:hypothetical protein
LFMKHSGPAGFIKETGRGSPEVRKMRGWKRAVRLPQKVGDGVSWRFRLLAESAAKTGRSFALSLQVPPEL